MSLLLMMENTTVVHNRVALVTGGARGIGKAVVERLAKEGYSIAINYNNSEERAKNLLQELTNAVHHIIFDCISVRRQT